MSGTRGEDWGVNSLVIYVWESACTLSPERDCAIIFHTQKGSGEQSYLCVIYCIDQYMWYDLVWLHGRAIPSLFRHTER